MRLRDLPFGFWLIGALTIGSGFLLHKCSRDCKAKGGVYLMHEYKCVKGIEEIE